MKKEKRKGRKKKKTCKEKYYMKIKKNTYS